MAEAPVTARNTPVPITPIRGHMRPTDCINAPKIGTYISRAFGLWQRDMFSEREKRCGTQGSLKVLVIEQSRHHYAGENSLACFRHSFKSQLLKSGSCLCDIQITFGVSRDLMARADHARRLDVADDLERLAIKDENSIAASDIKELLVGIRRHREVASKRYVGLNELF